MGLLVQDRTIKNKAYVSIVTVVLLMLISITAIVTIITVLIDQNVSYRSVINGATARLNADTCAEIAINKLKEDYAYIGNENYVLNRGSCTVVGLLGTGNDTRTINLQGEFDNNIRKVKVVITQVNPQTLIESWTEVNDF